MYKTSRKELHMLRTEVRFLMIIWCCTLHPSPEKLAKS